MKGKLLILNHAFLFLGTSMYLGTGGSLVLFSFTVVSQLTPDNYYLQFVPQIQAATEFFTPLSKAMIASSVVMLISEWRTSLRWVPIVVLICVSSAAALTVYGIFPLNAEMAEHIRDADRLKVVLDEWTHRSRIRAALWCLQWAAMMFYFMRWAYLARFPQWKR